MTRIAGMMALIATVVVGATTWTRRGPVAAVGAMLGTLFLCVVAYLLVVYALVFAFHVD